MNSEMIYIAILLNPNKYMPLYIDLSLYIFYKVVNKIQSM